MMTSLYNKFVCQKRARNYIERHYNAPDKLFYVKNEMLITYCFYMRIATLYSLCQYDCLLCTCDYAVRHMCATILTN